MKPEDFFSMLADSTRLRALMLILAEDEVCVCEMIHALRESQPKISRHLALMRDAGLVEPRREGTRMYYRIARDIPAWATGSLQQTLPWLEGLHPYSADRVRLQEMTERPGIIAGT